MKRTLLAALLAIAVCPGLLQAAPVTYMGTLAYTGAINTPLIVESLGSVGWSKLNGGVVATVSWTVDNWTSPGWWHYEYGIQVPSDGRRYTDIQCVLIETSGTFSWDSIRPDSLSVTPDNWLADTDIGSFSRLNQLNPVRLPNLPSAVYGILFRTENIDPTDLTISFDSNRAPVWGDIYARSFIVNNNEFNALHNAGWPYFGETDPNAPPSNGSVNNHVLVPDSLETPTGAVPAPAAVLLGTLGVSLTGWLRRRRWL